MADRHLPIDQVNHDAGPVTPRKVVDNITENGNLDIDRIRPDAGRTTAKDIRYGLLELAGFTREELSILVRKSVQTLEDTLTADQIQVLSYMGQKGDEIVKPDHPTRLKAAQELLRFTDVKPSTHEVHRQINTINYVVPEIYTTDESSKPPQVINNGDT